MKIQSAVCGMGHLAHEGLQNYYLMAEPMTSPRVERHVAHFTPILGIVYYMLALEISSALTYVFSNYTTTQISPTVEGCPHSSNTMRYSY